MSATRRVAFVALGPDPYGDGGTLATLQLGTVILTVIGNGSKRPLKLLMIELDFCFKQVLLAA